MCVGVLGVIWLHKQRCDIMVMGDGDESGWGGYG